MTTPLPRRLAAASSLRRDQYIAALLVGTVVILLGVASGIGISTATVAQPAIAPTLSTTNPGALPGPANTSNPPAPAAPVGVAPPVAYVMSPVPSRPTAAATTPVSAVTTHPTGPQSSGAPGPSPASCSQSMLTELLGRLVSAQGGADGLLAVLTGLLGPVFDLSGTASSLLMLSPAQLLTQVTAALGASLAPACTSELTGVLPLLARGTSLSGALAAPEAGPR